MDPHEEERPVKRFKHQSYKDTLRGVHLPSALNQSKFDDVIADNDSHFHEALDHWRELNLSPAFVKFARHADPLSASMPLLLHNCEAVIDLWLEALDGADDEALKALLDLFQKLSHDLRTTLAPKYPTVLLRLTQLLPRSLSAPTLTALLATFSALFKYVLIPAVDTELLDQAWAVFRETLLRCDPEVQRATAEVWGAALRRLKASTREHCVRLIAASAESSLADACVWVYVSACKSVSQTLHTSTSSLFRPLLSYYLECGTPEMSLKLIRRVMTALIHHCKDSEQFSSVAEVVLEQFLQCAKAESGDADEERLRRMLEVAAVACSVRQGSRMTHKQLLTMLSEFDKIPLTDALHSSVLKFTTSILLAGDMALWMASGRKVLERTWERPALALELCGALSDLGWGGWKMVAQPHVMKHTAELLQSHPHRTLELLVALHREKRLVGVDVVWKQRLQEWADRTFARWEQTEDNILLLHDALSLSSLMPTLSPILIRVIDATLQSPNPLQEYEQSFANSAWVLGVCMRSLSMRQPAEWSNDVPLSSWTQVIVEKWNWSGVALGGLVALIRTRYVCNADTSIKMTNRWLAATLLLMQ
ncbi:uncharacterized protein LAESUDRAFT_682314 [Laetiporus sulphureus 93-53]|uniref:Uncharacterized protein n=1 Tax=Laetiporus sulphureus 93-53 TaxID=1314785 RepID=A0A165DGJ8_9APHY|nr:uncharacterized protein LAESUDRAFT_682314 [Laetiporus sulphureus 93-53]KZT04836.1 hypothetical protein LAESUDRAFT_682314 [Laetiporus sulphureus 93-53]